MPRFSFFITPSILSRLHGEEQLVTHVIFLSFGFSGVVAAVVHGQKEGGFPFELVRIFRLRNIMTDEEITRESCFCPSWCGVACQGGL